MFFFLETQSALCFVTPMPPHHLCCALWCLMCMPFIFQTCLPHDYRSLLAFWLVAVIDERQTIFSLDLFSFESEKSRRPQRVKNKLREGRCDHHGASILRTLPALTFTKMRSPCEINIVVKGAESRFGNGIAGCCWFLLHKKKRLIIEQRHYYAAKAFLLHTYSVVDAET